MRFNELRPRAPGGPRVRSGKVTNLAENTKSIKTLGVGGLYCFPDPVAGPHDPKPHLHSQHFRLPVLALGGWLRELRAPRLLTRATQSLAMQLLSTRS